MDGALWSVGATARMQSVALLEFLDDPREGGFRVAGEPLRLVVQERPVGRDHSGVS